MALYTSNYLKAVASTTPLFESARMFSESQSKNTFDIFLSHSYLDKEVVRGLYFELTRMGFSVYVDWIVDPYLDRNNVTKETATIVRNRLKSSKMLLLGISVNATISKWIPWELGYVDGNTSNCAIIPVSDSITAPSSYTGSEYLSLYPFISKVEDIQGIQRLWAVESANNYVRLNEMIGGVKPSFKNKRIF